MVKKKEDVYRNKILESYELKKYIQRTNSAIGNNRDCLLGENYKSHFITKKRGVPF